MTVLTDPVCKNNVAASTGNQMFCCFSCPLVKSGSKKRYSSRILLSLPSAEDYHRNSGFGKLFHIVCLETSRTDNDPIVLTADDLRYKFLGIAIPTKGNQIAGIVCILIHLIYNTCKIFIRDMICDEQDLIAGFPF